MSKDVYIHRLVFDGPTVQISRSRQLLVPMYGTQECNGENFATAGSAHCSPNAPENEVAAVQSSPAPPQPAKNTMFSYVSSLPIDKLLAFIFGIVFVAVLLLVAVFDRNPPPFSEFIYRVILALAAAGVGAVIPGMLDVKSSWVRASGALALFVIVYRINPARIGVPATSRREK
jgi:hypothetical protein